MGLSSLRPKTRKSREAVPIPPVFVPFLRDHQARQEALRAAAEELWREHDVVLSRPDGRPLDPRADYEEFKELLKEVWIDDRRLYDGSDHTAGTILNAQGVVVPTIMEALRHTQISKVSAAALRPTPSRTERAPFAEGVPWDFQPHQPAWA
ncbi:hypothetical protein [Streptomyces anulatus]|uniref:hypothetical protein n=1 Tax=Streptomyces anulatus TaxID=1892 RepID=UPI0038697360